MKTIRISKEQSDKIWSVLKIIFGLSGLGSIVCAAVIIMGKESYFSFFDLFFTCVWALFLILFSLVVIYGYKKHMVYLTTEMVTVSQTVNEDYWLACSYKKKVAQNETIYDVVYFDEGKQVLTETLTENRFAKKIGEGSTYFKTVKRECSFSFGIDKIKGVIYWLKSPWLCIEEEGIVPLCGLYNYSFTGHSSVVEELNKKYKITLYGIEAVKPQEREYLDCLKEDYLHHVAAYMNSSEFSRSNIFKVNAIVLSEKNFKTRSQVEPNLIKNVENSK